MNSLKYLSLIFLVSITSVQAQINFDKRIKRHVNCEDVALFAIETLPRFITEHQYDSVEMLINYWERKCGESREILLTRDLLSVQNGTFDENQIDQNFFEETLGLDQPYSNYYLHLGYDNRYDYSFQRGRWPTNYDKYLHATQDWVQELLSDYSPCSDTYGWLLSKGADRSDYLEWLKGDCDNKLSTFYRLVVERNQKLPDTDVGGFLEAFIPEPTKHVSRLGVHPSVGFYAGIHHNRFFYRGTISFKFIKTPQPYQVLLKDSVHTTSYFFGGFVGGEVGYTLIKGKNHWFYLTGGMGLDGFGTFKPDEDDDDSPSNSINAFNMNVGVGSRIFLADQQTYLGYEIRYNRVNYSNIGGTNFDGNVINFRIIVGGFTNYSKQRNLRILEAPYR